MTERAASLQVPDVELSVGSSVDFREIFRTECSYVFHSLRRLGVAIDVRTYDAFYLRPTNGRADDQVRRNHSTQYSAHPDFDFARSRKEAPEKYESYVDLEPGVWTRYRIEVEGSKARLYVHGTPQPVLIVNDLRHEPRAGQVALWVGPGTDGYVSNLKITPK